RRSHLPSPYTTLFRSASGAVRGEAPAPAGYTIRRASQADARSVARLHEETLRVPVRSEDLHNLSKQSDMRVFLAEREAFPMGLRSEEHTSELQSRSDL